jgi:hypothetical protein
MLRLHDGSPSDSTARPIYDARAHDMWESIFGAELVGSHPNDRNCGRGIHFPNAELGSD